MVIGKTCPFVSSSFQKAAHRFPGKVSILQSIEETEAEPDSSLRECVKRAVRRRRAVQTGPAQNAPLFLKGLRGVGGGNAMDIEGYNSGLPKSVGRTINGDVIP